MPAWRAGGRLESSVASALSQRGVSVEVLIVDDASPDDTLREARRLAADDRRLRVMRLEYNGGPAAARNAALDQARGRWVAVLDADDAMLPDRLSKMIALAERSGADIVLGNLLETRADGSPLSGTPFLPDRRAPAEITPAEFVAGNMPGDGGRSLGYLKPLIRRDLIERSGLRYDPTLRNGEDYHLILSAYAAGARVWLSPDPDYLYARHEGSISHRSAPDHLEALLKAEERAAPAFASAPELRRLLARRRRALAQVLIAETVMQSLKRGDLRRAAGALLRHPHAGARLAMQLREAAAKRLRRPANRATPAGLATEGKRS